jgi:hypothetical protein
MKFVVYRNFQSYDDTFWDNEESGSPFRDVFYSVGEE